MIRGVHTMFYSSRRTSSGLPPRQAQLHGPRRRRRLAHLRLPEADMGCHPAEDKDGGRTGTHNISFYCDDIEKTVAELKAKGVVFTMPVADHGYGLVTYFKAPAGSTCNCTAAICEG